MILPLPFAASWDISTSFTLLGVGGVGFMASMIPMGWMYKYKPIHNFEYLCATEAAKVIQ